MPGSFNSPSDKNSGEDNATPTSCIVPDENRHDEALSDALSEVVGAIAEPAFAIRRLPSSLINPILEVGKKAKNETATKKSVTPNDR